jgi:hypothetical protein
VKFFNARESLFGIKIRQWFAVASLLFCEGPVWLCDENLLFTKDVYGL